MLHAVMQFFFHASPALIYGVVALVLLLESTGVPIANSTLLLLTGALASQGHCNIWLLGSAAWLGSVAGACIAYGIGARDGRVLLVRLAGFFHIDEQKVVLVERWFQRSGVGMVFLSRIIPYIRPFSCFPAGIMRTAFLRFLIAASLGSLIWCVAILALGWNLGRRWMIAMHAIQHDTVPALLIIVLCGALYLLGMTMVKRRLNRLSVPMEDRELASEPLSSSKQTCNL